MKFMTQKDYTDLIPPPSGLVPSISVPLPECPQKATTPKKAKRALLRVLLEKETGCMLRCVARLSACPRNPLWLKASSLRTWWLLGIVGVILFFGKVQEVLVSLLPYDPTGKWSRLSPAEMEELQDRSSRAIELAKKLGLPFVRAKWREDFAKRQREFFRWA